MKTPKILPWLARKHGVSEARAGELWADAVRYATDKTGWVGTSDYWQAAKNRLVELLQAEGPRACRPPLVQVVRAHNHLWLLPLLTWEETTLAAAAAWTARRDRWDERG